MADSEPMEARQKRRKVSGKTGPAAGAAIGGSPGMAARAASVTGAPEVPSHPAGARVQAPPAVPSSGASSSGLAAKGASGPAARAAGIAEAAPETAPAEELLCAPAQQVLGRYSRGAQLIPLEKLGVSPLDRRINGPHVHTIAKRILTMEDFVRFRYRHGWCHSPNPEDPLEVPRVTNAAAERGGLQARVPEVPLYGSFAKTHVLSFLHALKKILRECHRSHGLGSPGEV